MTKNPPNGTKKHRESTESESHQMVMRTEAERTVAGQRVSPVIPSARLSNGNAEESL